MTVFGKGLKSACVTGEKKKCIIGILGGIGAGKSTVAAELAKLGCAVIDADKIAGQLLQTDAVKAQIRSKFGQAVFDANGCIDRKKLAEIAFQGHDKIKLLNQIIHPLTLKRAEEMIAKCENEEKAAAIVLDMPLLAEVGWDKRCDKLIFVDCHEKKRLQRLKEPAFFDEKPLYDEKHLKARENFQISLDSKAEIAHYIIDNNSDIPALVKQVSRIFSCIETSSG